MGSESRADFEKVKKISNEINSGNHNFYDKATYLAPKDLRDSETV